MYSDFIPVSEKGQKTKYWKMIKSASEKFFIRAKAVYML